MTDREFSAMTLLKLQHGTSCVQEGEVILISKSSYTLATKEIFWFKLPSTYFWITTEWEVKYTDRRKTYGMYFYKENELVAWGEAVEQRGERGSLEKVIKTPETICYDR